jgi:hypothetical protein
MYVAFALGGAALGTVRHPVAWRVLTIAANTAWLVSDLLYRDWFGVAVSAACLALVLGRDFWNKRGKRVARQLGAESRALVAGLVERVRETAAPVPEGAGG